MPFFMHQNLTVWLCVNGNLVLMRNLWIKDLSHTIMEKKAQFFTDSAFGYIVSVYWPNFIVLVVTYILLCVKHLIGLDVLVSIWLVPIVLWCLMSHGIHVMTLKLSVGKKRISNVSNNILVGSLKVESTNLTSLPLCLAVVLIT